MSFSISIDRTAEKHLLARYTPVKVEVILREAAAAGAESARMVMSSQAPIGTAQRLSQYYRKLHLRHGALRGSVRSAEIHNRLTGMVGRVIGPMGRGAVARAFVAVRKHWPASSARTALFAAQRASDTVLEAYARG